MSLNQTGTHACIAPCVTRPLPAKKSTKLDVGRIMGPKEQFSREVSSVWVGDESQTGVCQRKTFRPAPLITNGELMFLALAMAVYSISEILFAFLIGFNFPSSISRQ